MIDIKIGEFVYSDVRIVLDKESYLTKTKDPILIENRRSSTVSLTLKDISSGIMVFGFNNNGRLVQKEAIYLATQGSHQLEVYGKVIFIAKLQYLIFDALTYLEHKFEILRYIPTRKNYHIDQYFNDQKGSKESNWAAFRSAMERDIIILSDEELVSLFNSFKIPLTYWNTHMTIKYGEIERQFLKRMINIDCIRTEDGISLKRKVRLDNVNRRLELVK